MTDRPQSFWVNANGDHVILPHPITVDSTTSIRSNDATLTTIDGLITKTAITIDISTEKKKNKAYVLDTYELFYKKLRSDYQLQIAAICLSFCGWSPDKIYLEYTKHKEPRMFLYRIAFWFLKRKRDRQVSLFHPIKKISCDKEGLVSKIVREHVTTDDKKLANFRSHVFKYFNGQPIALFLLGSSFTYRDNVFDGDTILISTSGYFYESMSIEHLEFLEILLRSNTFLPFLYSYDIYRSIQYNRSERLILIQSFLVLMA